LELETDLVYVPSDPTPTSQDAERWSYQSTSAYFKARLDFSQDQDSLVKLFFAVCVAPPTSKAGGGRGKDPALNGHLLVEGLVAFIVDDDVVTLHGESIGPGEETDMYPLAENVLHLVCQTDDSITITFQLPVKLIPSHAVQLKTSST
jgi:hypothetical protein